MGGNFLIFPRLPSLTLSPMRPRLRPSTTPFCAQITSRDAPRGDSFASAAFPHHHHHHHRSSSSSLKNISLVLISLSSRPTFSRTFEKKATGLSKVLFRDPPPSSHKIQVSLRKSLYIPRANETSNGCALSFFLSFFPSFVPSRSVVMRVSSSRAGVRPARSNCVSLYMDEG